MKIIYTLDEAAAKLGFSRKTLQREINAGRYPNSFKVGKRSCTYSTDVEAYQAKLAEEDDIMRRDAEEEAASRLQFERRYEAHFRQPHYDDSASALIRTFSPGDPNRLP